MIDRAFRTVGPALLLLFAALVVLAVIAIGQAGVSHRGGGCNHVPLVNGQPAYACPSPPP
jgi:hypothetical protein